MRPRSTSFLPVALTHMHTCCQEGGPGDLTFNALMTVSMWVFTASWENSELARVHMLSRARYRRLVSLCCKN